MSESKHMAADGKSVTGTEGLYDLYGASSKSVPHDDAGIGALVKNPVGRMLLPPHWSQTYPEPYSDVAVLVPCYNEEQTVGKVIDDFREWLPGATIYVCDNASTDRTAHEAIFHGATLMREGRKGKGNAVRTMFSDIDAAIYLMVDGDDTYPADAAPDLVEAIRDGADMAIGDRLSNGSYGRENKRVFHGMGNSVVRWSISFLYGLEFTDVMTGYRAFSRPFVRTFPCMTRGFQIESELSIHAADHNLRVTSVPVDYRDRPEGSSSKLDTIPDGLRVLRLIAAQFKDRRPMRFFTFLAVLSWVICLVLGIPVIDEFVHTGEVPKLPTAVLAASIAVLGALCLFTGLILDTIAKNERTRWEMAWTEAKREERVLAEREERAQ